MKHTFAEPLVMPAGNAWWTNGPEGGAVDVSVGDEFYRGCQVMHPRDGGDPYVLVEHSVHGWVAAQFKLNKVCKGPMPEVLIISGGF